MQEALDVQSKELAIYAANSNEAHTLKTRILELEKERMNLSSRLKEKEEDLAKASDKYQAIIK